MATPYSEIYNVFLSQVPDEILMSLDESDREEMLFGYLNVAQAQFRRICIKVANIDLADRDNTLQQYADDLPEEVVHILALGMVWARANYKLNHSDNMSNFLNSRDLALAGSPGNLLKELRLYTNKAYADFRREMVLYSYDASDFENLTT